MPHEASTNSPDSELLARISAWRSGDATEDEAVELARLASLGSLACMLAHEMNNALTPALSYARMALEAPANESLNRRAHESAIQGVEACQAIAESLLGFARDEEPADRTADVARCVDRSLNCLPRDIQKDGVTVEIVIESELRAAIRPVSLEQVLLNLILNARRAMRQGGRLRITACSTWNTGVRLTVGDTGEGMTAEQVERVFEPFVSFAERERGGGAGLGLAICRRLIEAAGGSIRVESAPGEGALFTIELPSAQAAMRTRAA